MPVYYGASKDVGKVLPPHSYVDANAFESPQAAAAHVETIAHNVTAYMEYHQWRRDERSVR